MVGGSAMVGTLLITPRGDFHVHLGAVGSAAAAHRASSLRSSATPTPSFSGRAEPRKPAMHASKAGSAPTAGKSNTNTSSRVANCGQLPPQVPACSRLGPYLNETAQVHLCKKTFREGGALYLKGLGGLRGVPRTGTGLPLAVQTDSVRCAQHSARPVPQQSVARETLRPLRPAEAGEGGAPPAAAHTLSQPRPLCCCFRGHPAYVAAVRRTRPCECQSRLSGRKSRGASPECIAWAAAGPHQLSLASQSM